MKSPGIYKIQSIKFAERFYIGSALNLSRRSGEHMRRLLSGKHINKRLQGHINKYGIDDLVILIVEIVEDKNKLIEREQHYIDLLRPSFNICKVAGSTLGRPQSIETRQKRSVAHKGKLIPIDQREKMAAAARKRNPVPDEVNGFKIIREVGLTVNRNRLFICRCKSCQKEIKSTIHQVRNRKAPHCGCMFLPKVKEKKAHKALREYKVSSLNTSGYAGVVYRKDKRLWIARVRVEKGKQKSVGYYKTATEAAIARNEYIIKNNLSDTRLCEVADR